MKKVLFCDIPVFFKQKKKLKNEKLHVRKKICIIEEKIHKRKLTDGNEGNIVSSRLNEKQKLSSLVFVKREEWKTKQQKLYHE